MAKEKETTKKVTDEKKKVQSTEKKKTTTKGTSKTDKDGKTTKAKSTKTTSSKSTSSKTTKALISNTNPGKKPAVRPKPIAHPKKDSVAKETKVENLDNSFISNFLNNIYSDSALYLNYRNTSSFIDGLKNSGRKVIYTVKKRNVKSDAKVCNFAGLVTDESQYLHGPASMEGVIVTLAQDYCGANNLPYLKGIGAFGTRFSPNAAASRYIFIKQTDYTNELFKKEDDCNLIAQEFEGNEIEPMFYTPTLPTLLVNGTVGIGVGFASTVLSRSLPNVITMVENKINKKPLKDELFIPSWKGFKGTVKEIEPNKWEISGLAEIDGNKVTITEVPISWDLMSYTEHLKSLRDKPKDEKKAKKWVKKIEKFVDFSEDENFKFDIRLTPDEAAKTKSEILKDLGLVETITENLTCIDENNAIREFTSVKEIFEEYYRIKIEYLEKRIKSEIVRLTNEYNYLYELYKFIMEVVKGTINIKLKKAEVESIMKEKGYANIDKLISIPLYSITKDKAEEAKARADDKKAEVEAMKKETPENYWKKDLEELKKVLIKEGII